MQRTNMLFKNILKKFTSLIVALVTSVLFAAPAYASKIGDSKLAKGTENLANDASTWLLFIAPIVGGCFIVYFFIRRSGADEMDQKKWNNRITTAIISTIGAVIGISLLSIVLSYYQ